VGLHIPVIVRLEGTNADKAKVIIQNSGMGSLLQEAAGLKDAAAKAVAAAREQEARLAAQPARTAPGSAPRAAKPAATPARRTASKRSAAKRPAKSARGRGKKAAVRRKR
jgi:hypothetical protein